MTNLALRGLLSHSQHLFCLRQGQILVREGLLKDVSDFDSNDSVEVDDRENRRVSDAPKIQEQHGYVDVLSARLNEVDQRLLKYSIDMNIKHEEQPHDMDLKQQRTQIQLNRQSTMFTLSQAKALEMKQAKLKKQSNAALNTIDQDLNDGKTIINNLQMNIIENASSNNLLKSQKHLHAKD